MEKNKMSRLTPDEIVFKLFRQEATIKRENRHGYDALLYVNGTVKSSWKEKVKDRMCGNGDERETRISIAIAN
jgi:hypothetical protein